MIELTQLSELAKLEARRDIDEDIRNTVEQLLNDIAYFKTEPGSSSPQEEYGTGQHQPESLVNMHEPHPGR